jgi:hypothetical protein
MASLHCLPACSVLVDMTKTAGDFRAAANKALESVADGLLPRLRPILDEVATVRALLRCVLRCR